MGLLDFHWGHVDHVLISAFIERWHVDTSSFQFPWGDMTVTLQDVKMLTGISMDGASCRLTGVDLEDATDQIFDFTPAEGAAHVRRGRIAVVSALAALDLLVRGHGVERAADFASGILGILLTGTLFMDKSGNQMCQAILSLLMDHGQTSGYS